MITLSVPKCLIIIVVAFIYITMYNCMSLVIFINILSIFSLTLLFI